MHSIGRRIKVIQYGLGPIGCKSVQYLSERRQFEIVGAVDIDPEKVGSDVGELAGLPGPIGLSVTDDAKRLLAEVDADIVVLTTTSSLEQVRSQVVEIVSAGRNVVSTCEELMYPWLTNPGIAREIDLAAREHEVSVLSTGVNPGFLMDFLPLVLTGICRDVKKLKVERVQNAQIRRVPFQKKIGAGLTVLEFEQRAKAGILRHVGLTESIHLIASGVGWNLDRTEDIVKPVVASAPVTTDALIIESGNVLGVNQIGRGYLDGEEVISLVFTATIGEPHPLDRIVIEGDPSIDLVISGGVNGDTATCAIVVNAIPVVIEAAPGLKSMADIKPISFKD